MLAEFENIVVGNEYIVKDIQYCRKCGVQWISIGTIVPECDELMCANCGNLSYPEDNFLWVESYYFKKS